MKKIYCSILAVFLLFHTFTPLVTVSAASSYDVKALSKYAGFGESVFSYYTNGYASVAASHTENKAYLDGVTDSIEEGSRSFFKRLISRDCGTFDFSCAMEKTSDHILSIGAAAMTGMGLVREFFFGRAEEEGTVDTSIFDEYFDYVSLQISPKTGYEIVVNYGTNVTIVPWNGSLNFSSNYSAGYIRVCIAGQCNRVASDQKEISTEYFQSINKGNVLSKFADFGLSIGFRESSTQKPVNPIFVPNPNYTTINNYVQNEPLPVLQQPNIYPVLKCTNNDIELQLKNNDFFLDGQLLQIPFNGEYVHSGQQCELKFNTDPIVINEKNEVVIVLPDNTTQPLVIGETDTPTHPIEPIDTSILQYIRNSYDYAVSAVQTGVDGLQKVTTGFVGLTTIAGSVFAFMPTEMTVFITGAFLVVIGLWVVKR